MTIRELKLVIETAKNFVNMDSHIVISDGRDGVDSYMIASAELIKIGPPLQEEIILAFRSKQ